MHIARLIIFILLFSFCKEENNNSFIKDLKFDFYKDSIANIALIESDNNFKYYKKYSNVKLGKIDIIAPIYGFYNNKLFYIEMDIPLDKKYDVLTFLIDKNGKNYQLVINDDYLECQWQKNNFIITFIDYDNKCNLFINKQKI